MEIIEQRVISSDQIHVVCITLPAQGHINPMLQFCKRLASKGLMATLICTNAITRKCIQTQATSINVEHISNGSNDDESPGNFGLCLDRFQTFVSLFHKTSLNSLRNK
ncbi:hypothetical protein Patl1_26908 [Pistacia atlantica]|uniref:Uncharacterized protein n=1 Tax=Pistacia atlantica TaxID=434234 RepID=A0ACC1B3W5_9ROSI|nr:hypothetical protein Patl1_26908 [Pistacia atlantica]